MQRYEWAIQLIICPLVRGPLVRCPLVSLLVILSVLNRANSAILLDGDTSGLNDLQRREIHQIITSDPFQNLTEINKKLAVFGLRGRWIPDTLFQAYQIKKYLKDPGTSLTHRASAKVKESWQNDETGKGCTYNRAHAVQNSDSFDPELTDHYFEVNQELRNIIPKNSDFSAALDQIFNDDSLSSNKKWKNLTEEKEAFKRAFEIEESAHDQGKIALWRYSLGTPYYQQQQLLDCIISCQDSLVKAMKFGSPKIFNRAFSYGLHFLGGFMNDGGIPDEITLRTNLAEVSACTFSYYRTHRLIVEQLNKSKKNQDSNPEELSKTENTLKKAAVYVLELTPEDMKAMGDSLYYPQASTFDSDVFGTGENFHSRIGTTEKRPFESLLDSARLVETFPRLLADHTQVLYLDNRLVNQQTDPTVIQAKEALKSAQAQIEDSNLATNLAIDSINRATRFINYNLSDIAKKCGDLSSSQCP